MKKGIKITLAILILAVIAISLIYRFYLNKPHQKPSDVQEKVAVLAPDLFKIFNEKEEEAKKLYFEKDVHVEGTISKLTSSEGTAEQRYTVILDCKDSTGTISCELLPEQSPRAKTLKEGEKIKISGFCNGINRGDEMMGLPSDVVLEKCSIL